MSNSTLKILRNAINLSGMHSSDFNESELAEKSGLSPQQVIELIRADEIQPFFSITKRSRIKCPKCSSMINIDSSIAVSFCSECNEEINMSKVPVFTIGLNRQEAQIYLIEFLLKKFEGAGWKVRDSDENFFIIKNDKVSVAFSVCLNGNGLKDYFALKGWGSEYNPNTFVVISNSFDKFILAYQDKNLECLLIQIDSVFNDDFVPSSLQQVNERAELYDREKEAEQKIEIEFKKFGDLQKVLEQQEELIRMLPSRALQKTQETVIRQGKQFEKDIVKILNFTILRTKYAGGRNEPDGIGIITHYDKNKSKWFPMEIKSFTPEDESKQFYPLKEVVRQIDKYSNALENEGITKILEVPAFLAIAYDFDIESEEEKTLIETFQANHSNKRLVLLPLKSTIRIFKLFIENNIFSLPSDIIERWLLRSNYITESQVDDLFKELNKHNKEQFQDQMKVLRKKTEEQGK